MERSPASRLGLRGKCAPGTLRPAGAKVFAHRVLVASLLLGSWLSAARGEDDPYLNSLRSPIDSTPVVSSLVFAGAPKLSALALRDLPAVAPGDVAPPLPESAAPLPTASPFADLEPFRVALAQIDLLQPPPVAPGNAAPPQAAGASDEPQTFGPEPEPTNLVFLRTQTVLLRPGDWQFDYGLVYSLFQDDVPVALLADDGTVEDVDEATARRRLLYIPFEVRYGLSRRVQLYAALPIGWSNSEFTLVGFDESSNRFSVGDLDTGISILACESRCLYEPDVVFTFTLTWPTGSTAGALVRLSPDVTLGEGLWATTANVLFIHTIDPLIVFYGAGHTHRFGQNIAGVDFQPGEEFFYQLGVGFAVNEKVTLATSFLGYYITDTYLDDERLAGTSLEPMRMRFSATIASPRRIIEPFAEIGMTPDAADAQFGIVWTL